MKHHHKTNWTKNLRQDDLEDRGAWACNSKNSEYHFDSTRQDEPEEYYKILGWFDLDHPDIQRELDWIDSRALWEQGKLSEGTTFDSLSDTAKNLNFGNPLENKKSSGSKKGFQSTLHEMMFPILYQLKHYSGLKFYDEDDHNKNKHLPPSARIICQAPGHMFQIHIDNELWNVNPEDPSQVVRMVIMLDDWKAGHIYQYGNTVYQGWRKGEVHVFDWPNIPHSTANTSKINRPSLQFTGLKTPLYDELYKNGSRDTKISWNF